MTHIAVESTTLATMAYDQQRAILQIEFCDRRRYEYLQVPTEVYDGLLRAPSKGNYFNRVIRGKYQYSRRGRFLS